MITNKDLYQALDGLGLLEYGSAIKEELVLNILGLVKPEVGTWREFENINLRVLQGMGYVRDALVRKGMYLKQVNGDFRILLPSENAKQKQSMIDSANAKLRKAQILMDNTPMSDMAQRDNSTPTLIKMQSQRRM